MIPAEYLAHIKTRLVTSEGILSFEMVEEWAQSDRGYVRIRMHLINGDFLEAAEYFVLSGETCLPERYRYQWMDSTQQQMDKRWDNVAHHPDLPNFPHHVHFRDGRVEPGERLSIMDLLDRLAELNL